MALNCGIVGLPNIGKSTIFSALTSAPAQRANYPFCTIEPNHGITSVPDPRLERIAALIPAEKTVPALIEFVDIAGLVQGASTGEGLGNQFLAHIREVDLIVHVVRCFEDGEIVHVNGTVNPLEDIATINTELNLADLSTLDKAKDRCQRLSRSNDAKQRKETAGLLELIEKLEAHLNAFQPVRSFEASDQEAEQIRSLHLITAKPQLYVCNLDEAGLHHFAGKFPELLEIAEKEATEILPICGKLEADIAEIDSAEERDFFLQESGLEEPGLHKLARTAYRELSLGSFFTVGSTENRAWTFRIGDLAPQCGGKIHSDFEKGFIKAEVYHCEDLFTEGSEANVKKAGKLRLEGKAYPVQDGDILHFRFNH